MAETETKAVEQEPGPAGPAAAPRAVTTARRRSWLRPLLLIAGPAVVLIAGAWVYMNTGRYVATDNAYIKAGGIIVGAEVAGRVVRVAVHENQLVEAGDVLLAIDDSAYRVARDRAAAQTEAVRSFVVALQYSYQQALEELELARSNVAFAERAAEREQALAERQLGSESDLDDARHKLEVASLQIPIIEQRLAQLSAQLGGRTHGEWRDHPAYRTASTMLENAELELEHTLVRAPFRGVVTNVPPPGAYLARGAPAMGLISADNVWIEANYKETQLGNVRAGQPASVTIDAYPGREWSGRVESISQATGAELSVIPAQNASGNWVKIAQRIPVRIVLDGGPEEFTLRAGMSAVVEVDTGLERPTPRFLGFLSGLRSPRTKRDAAPGIRVRE